MQVPGTGAAPPSASPRSFFGGRLAGAAAARGGAPGQVCPLLIRWWGWYIPPLSPALAGGSFSAVIPVLNGRISLVRGVLRLLFPPACGKDRAVGLHLLRVYFGGGKIRSLLLVLLASFVVCS